jgi:GABA(A) receptor-associated protein
MFKKKNIEYNFKKKHNFEQRIKESDKIKTKYPERIPIIVEKSKSSKINSIDKNKFLVPNNLTAGQFLSIIRKRLKVKETDSIFLFINNNLPCYSSSIISLYETYKDTDGFLYVQYTEESTFG